MINFSVKISSQQEAHVAAETSAKASGARLTIFQQFGMNAQAVGFCFIFRAHTRYFPRLNQTS